VFWCDHVAGVTFLQNKKKPNLNHRNGVSLETKKNRKINCKHLFETSCSFVALQTMDGSNIVQMHYRFED